MYKVFQIRLSDADVDMINEHGHDSVPKQKARLGMQFDTDINVKAKEAFDNKMYDMVSTIDANDLEDVFHIGNMGPEEKITRLLPMHSISVGDIVQAPDGLFHVVADFGFKQVA